MRTLAFAVNAVIFAGCVIAADTDVQRAADTVCYAIMLAGALWSGLEK